MAETTGGRPCAMASIATRPSDSGRRDGNRDHVGPDVMRVRIRHERHHGDDVAESERRDGPREFTLASGVLEGVPDDADLGPDLVGQLGHGLDQDVLALDAADPSEHQQPQPAVTPIACRAEGEPDPRRRCRSPGPDAGRKREGARVARELKMMSAPLQRSIRRRSERTVPSGISCTWMMHLRGHRRDARM